MSWRTEVIVTTARRRCCGVFVISAPHVKLHTCLLSQYYLLNRPTNLVKGSAGLFCKHAQLSEDFQRNTGPVPYFKTLTILVNSFKELWKPRKDKARVFHYSTYSDATVCIWRQLNIESESKFSDYFLVSLKRGEVCINNHIFFKM